MKSMQDKWNKRWQNAENFEKISFLGKVMFKSKNVVLRKVLKDLDVKDVLEVGVVTVLRNL